MMPTILRKIRKGYNLKHNKFCIDYLFSCNQRGINYIFLWKNNWVVINKHDNNNNDDKKEINIKTRKRLFKCTKGEMDG